MTAITPTPVGSGSITQILAQCASRSAQDTVNTSVAMTGPIWVTRNWRKFFKLAADHDTAAGSVLDLRIGILDVKFQGPWWQRLFYRQIDIVVEGKNATVQALLRLIADKSK